MTDPARDWMLDRLVALERRVTELEQQLTLQPTTPAKGKAHALPLNWHPPEQVIAWVKEGYPNVVETDERDRFADYWRSRGDTRKDWTAAYRNWIRKAAEFSAPRPAVLSGRPVTRGSAITEANRQRRDRVADKLAALWGDTPR